MPDHLDLGKRGESLAAELLRLKGYRILAENYRIQRAEIDLIAQQGEVMVFVEVKTRSTARFGPPELSVDRKKRAILTDAAGYYCYEQEHEGEMRFDIISIVYESVKVTITHHEDAFFGVKRGFQ